MVLGSVFALSVSCLSLDDLPQPYASQNKLSKHGSGVGIRALAGGHSLVPAQTLGFQCISLRDRPLPNTLGERDGERERSVGPHTGARP